MANNRFTNLRRAKPVVATTTPPPANKADKQEEKEPSVRKVIAAQQIAEPDRLSAAEPSKILPVQTLELKQVNRGRPRAKRSDAGFAQATAYIKKDTYTAVRHLLLDQRKEYSVLVQELLEKWLKEQ